MNLIDNSGNNFTLLKFIINDKETLVKCYEKINEYKIRINVRLRDTNINFYDVSGNNNIFIYGQYVKDLNALNEEYIWTYIAAATKEIDNQLVSAQATIAQQSTTIAQQQITITNQEAQINNLTSMLEALTSRVTALENN